MIKEGKFILEVILNGNSNVDSQMLIDLDWDIVIRLCTRHKLLPVLYNRTCNNPNIPKHIHRILSNEYKIRKHVYIKQREEYFSLLDKLGKSGIHVILLKGVYLAEKCYNDPVERPYNDLDILIRENEVEEVFRILKANDYVQGEYDTNLCKIKEFDEDRLTGYASELQHYGEFLKLSNSDFFSVYPIDVHHRLNTVFDNFSYNSELLFRRAIKENIQGVTILRLSNEDFLLHLSSHLYWHTLSIRDIISGRDMRLLSYLDVALFVLSNNIDWEKLFSCAKEFKLENALYYVLYHCQLLFGKIVPEYVYKTWEMEKIRANSNTIYDRWFTRDTITPVGKWSHNFIERLFDENRKYEALLSFYNDYINKVLFSGSYFKVIDINSQERFS